jgi:hypothetical protein
MEKNWTFVSSYPNASQCNYSTHHPTEISQPCQPDGPQCRVTFHALPCPSSHLEHLPHKLLQCKIQKRQMINIFVLFTISQFYISLSAFLLSLLY